MPDLPDRTITLVFTDIEGSTRLLHRVGDRYAELLDEHRRVVRSALAARGGRGAHPWPDDAEVRVRVGIHTGRPRLVEGDYVGLDVHRVAR